MSVVHEAGNICMAGAHAQQLTEGRVLAQISFYDLGQTHTRELSSRVVIGGSGVVPLCMCVYATPGDEGSERIIYGDSQVQASAGPG